jgi:hypothetical protein
LGEKNQIVGGPLVQVTVSLTVEVAASANVDEVEALIVEAGRKAMVEALRGVCREYEAEARQCRKCGSEQLRTEGTYRRVLLTSFGKVVLNLRRLRCQECQVRVRPIEPLLKCLEGANVTGRLREACVLAGSSWPFKTASRVLKDLCGAKVSPESIRQITVDAGQKAAQQQAEAAQKVHNPTVESVRARRRLPVVKPPEMLLVGLDGGWVASRDNPGGMEGKVGVVATELEPVGIKGRRKLSVRKVVATFGESRHLGGLACAAAEELSGHDAHERVVLGDGANWIKTQSQQHFPRAVKILDWSHLWRATQKAVRAARPGKGCREERHSLYEQLRGYLWQGMVSEAIEVLLGLRGTERVEALEVAIGYIQNQHDWIGNYEQWQQTGYPVGSGLIERQVELVIDRRMKRQGMRWLRANANSLIALRVNQINYDWEEPQKLAA